MFHEDDEDDVFEAYEMDVSPSFSAPSYSNSSPIAPTTLFSDENFSSYNYEVVDDLIGISPEEVLVEAHSHETALPDDVYDIDTGAKEAHLLKSPALQRCGQPTNSGAIGISGPKVPASSTGVLLNAL